MPCGYFDSGEVFGNVVTDWVSPTTATPDIFSYDVNQDTCSNHPLANTTITILSQSPHDGIAMTGLINLINVPVARLYREYIQTKLIQPLTPGQRYHWGLYVNLADVSLISANNLGLYFSVAPPKSDTSNLLRVTPQVVVSEPITDKDDWVFINGIYEPEKKERYLTIGNFTSYEDIRIIPVDSTFSNEAKAFSDVVYYLIDSVFVEPIAELKIPNVFTPNGDEYNESFTIEGLQDNRWILTVINRWGQQVYQSVYYHNEWHGEGLSPGSYYYRLKHRYVEIEYKGELTILK